MRHEKFRFKDSDGNDVAEMQSFRAVPIYTISMTYEEMIATINKFAKPRKVQPNKKANNCPFAFELKDMWKH